MREPKKSPTGNVEYDEDALEKAAKRMHATGSSTATEKDPPGGHDDEALEDAADKMTGRDGGSEGH